MDSSRYNPSYGQSYDQFPPPSQSPHPQSYSENPNSYGGPSHNSQSYYYPLPPPPPVNQSPSYYTPAASQPHSHPAYNPHQYAYSPKQVSRPSFSSSSSHNQSQDASKPTLPGYQGASPGFGIQGVTAEYNRQFDCNPLSADLSGDRFTKGFESSSRFRDEVGGHGFDRKEVPVGRAEEIYSRRGQYQLNSGMSSRGLGDRNRRLESKSGYQDNHNGSTVDGKATSAANNENRRWIVDSAVTNECGARVNQNNDDYYRTQFEGSFNGGNRVGSDVLNRPASNQVQKESVLLRIQDPRNNQRSRGTERFRRFHHYDTKRSGSFRGEGLAGRSGHVMTTKHKEKTPMELDVSFKSNVLVARPTKTSAGTDSHMRVTPRARKIRRVFATAKDENLLSNMGTDIDTLPAEKISCSDIGIKQSKSAITESGRERKYPSESVHFSYSSKSKMIEKTALEEIALDEKVLVINKDIKTSLDEDKAENLRPVTNFPDGKVNAKMSDNMSETFRSGEASKHSKEFKANFPDGKMNAKMSDKQTVSGSDPSYPKVVVKKKVGKRAKRKVFRPRSELSASDLLEKFPKPVEDAKVAHCSSVVTGNKDGDTCLKQEVPFTGILSLCGGRSGPCIHGVSENDKKYEALYDPLREEVDAGEEGCKAYVGALGHQNMEIVATSMNAESLSNQEASDLLSTRSSIGNFEDESKRVYPKRDFLYPENDGLRECAKSLFPLRDYTESDTVNAEAYNDPDALQMEDQAGLSVENGNMKGSSGASAFRHNRLIPSPRSSEKPGDNLCLQDSVCCNHDIQTKYRSCSGLNFAEEKELISSCNKTRKAHVNNDISSLDSGATEGFIELMPQGGSKHDMFNRCKHREILSSELESPKKLPAGLSGQSVNVDSSAYGEEVTLEKDFTAKSGASEAVSVNTCIDGVSVLRSRGFISCFSDKVLHSNDNNLGSERTLPEGEAGVKVPNLSGDFFDPSSSEAKNGFGTANIVKFDMKLLSNFEDCPQKGKNKLPGLTIGCESGPPSFPGRSKSFLDNILGSEPSDAVVLGADSSLVCLSSDHLRVNSCLASKAMLGFEQIESAMPSKASDNCENDLTGKDLIRDENMVDASEEQLIPSYEATNPGLASRLIAYRTPVTTSINSSVGMDIESSDRENSSLGALEIRVTTRNVAVHSSESLEDHIPLSNQTSPGTDSESYKPSLSDLISSPAYQEVSTDKLSGDLCEMLPDTPSDTGSLDSLPGVTADIYLNNDAAHFQESDDRFCGNNRTLDDKDGGVGSSVAPSSICTASRKNACSNVTLGRSNSKLPSVSKNKAKFLIPISQKAHGKKIAHSYAVQKSYPGSSILCAAQKNVKAPADITRPRTWHRSSNSASFPSLDTKPLPSMIPTRRQPNMNLEIQSTYIRKGNSLVRKPALSKDSSVLLTSAKKLKISAAEKDKIIRSETSAVVDDQSILVKAGKGHTPFERPPTPPVASTLNSSEHVSVSFEQCLLSPRTRALTNSFTEDTPGALNPGETNAPSPFEDELMNLEVPENQTDHDLGSENMKEGTATGPTTIKSSKVVYVKRKSNQLVAASNVYNSCKAQIASSDGYYKRGKNQLIRTSDCQTNQVVSSPEDGSNAQVLVAAPKIITKKSFGGGLPYSRAVTKSFKNSKFSPVWTLSGAQLTKTDGVSLHRQKFLPQLFPWKRPTNRRCLMNSFSVFHNKSLSAIGQKMLLLRKRHTVYTRSINGYSLKKSKVLSIGGSHLKWSKSIERDSKKANEEATSAVAAVAKKNRERQSGSGISLKKNRSNFARERIFRIGSFRYKMDSSRRTLQRISDDVYPCSGATESGCSPKMSIVPRRLVIGNNEYVRVGTGNQLIRDPKKRTRALASEKVRWSLHTARLRLAKKRKYCQFFTRFGECSKDDGKCPYIHDPSKIAVCTKFLNGLCTNPECKLTHKVIPERMPDCSYFQLGLCNNEACPYRHVHVDPKAAICEGFLRGYCADGNECTKKHTYTCPVFEATGSCPQGSKCKLHHPKKRSKGRKRKRPCEESQKNARGRYFGTFGSSIPEPEPLVPERCVTESGVFEDEAAEYISLDVVEDETEESNGLMSEQALFDKSESLPLGMGFDGIDNLIKPVGIMDKKRTV